MGKIIIRDGIKWDYDWRSSRWVFIEKVEDETPKEEQPTEETNEDERPILKRRHKKKVED